jgi:hypothetical protein
MQDRLDRTELCHKGYVGQDRDTRIVPGRTGQETGMVCSIKNRTDRTGDSDSLSLKDKTEQERRLGLFVS